MKVGLALSAGGAKGLAHIGVIKALVENGVPVDCVAGTSAGSIVGAAFSAGMSVEQIANLAAKARWLALGRFAFSRFGLLSLTPMRNYIKQNIPARRFEDIKIPYACVATDLQSGGKVVLKETGELATAITASCAVPGIFVPVTIGEKKLIDGGIVEFTPTNTVRDLGANFVIAVDVIADDSRLAGTPQTALGVFFQSAMLLLKTAASVQHNYADIVIRPCVGHLRADEVGRAPEFIAAGEAAALAAMNDIKRLLENGKIQTVGGV